MIFPPTNGAIPSVVLPSSWGAPFTTAPISDMIDALNPCASRSVKYSSACAGDHRVSPAHGESPRTSSGLPSWSRK